MIPVKLLLTFFFTIFFAAFFTPSFATFDVLLAMICILLFG